jgi:cell division protein FtsW (lipid II flippase)
LGRKFLTQELKSDYGHSKRRPQKKPNRVNPVLRFRFDYWLLLAIAGMLVLGMLMVYSTTFDYGLRFRMIPPSTSGGSSWRWDWGLVAWSA